MTVSQGSTVHEVTTPSGIRVYYQSDPRLYRVNNLEVPSVSTVLKVLEKGGLSWWGMQVGIAGVIDLFGKGAVFYDPWAFDKLAVNAGEPNMATSATVENVTDLLKQHKLTVNHQLSKAGDRGTSVHRALEVWAEEGLVPDPDLYPDSERGYVAGLKRFIEDLPPVKVMGQETMVGSAEHGYAGRFDLTLCFNFDADLVTRQTPTGRITRQAFQDGFWLLDLKTSSGFYPSQFIQLEAYEQASVECGYPATVGRAVVRVDKNGFYEVRKSVATFSDFKAVLDVYRTLESLKARKQ